MAYDNVINSTNAAALIPEEVASEILKALPEQSAVMRLARKLPGMSRNQMRLPVMSALATAYFVTGENNKAQTTQIDWTNKYIDAEELAVVVPVSKRALDDSDFDIWSEAKNSIQEALGKAIDAAVLFGTNIPASWTTNLGAAGIKAVCSAASQTLSLAGYTDLYEALLGETAAGTDGCLMALETDGFVATGHVAHTSLRGKLRNCRDANGNPIFKSGPNLGSQFATGDLDGAPILYPLNGSVSASDALLIAGQWNQLVYSVRQDITWELATQAVIQDSGGNITYNLFQQNMVALKATMRLGFALPNPINRIQATAASRCAFAVLTA